VLRCAAVESMGAIKKKKNSVRLWQGVKMKHKKELLLKRIFLFVLVSFLFLRFSFGTKIIGSEREWWLLRARYRQENSSTSVEHGGGDLCLPKRSGIGAARSLCHSRCSLSIALHALTPSLAQCRLGTISLPPPLLPSISWAMVLISLELRLYRMGIASSSFMRQREKNGFPFR
jgi:hypothetical protein